MILRNYVSCPIGKIKSLISTCRGCNGIPIENPVAEDFVVVSITQSESTGHAVLEPVVMDFRIGDAIYYCWVVVYSIGAFHENVIVDGAIPGILQLNGDGICVCKVAVPDGQVVSK